MVIDDKLIQYLEDLSRLHLTEEEKEEQAALRKEYIEAVRRNMRGTLNNISIREADGTITDLGKKYGNKK